MRLPVRDYQIAIPSYQRPDTLIDRTLCYLLNTGVDPARVTVFTHDHDPNLRAYHDITRGAGVNLATTEARGIRQQRAAIIGHYPAGTPLVQADDDLTAIVEATDPKTLRPVPDADRFITGMFRETAAQDLHVWGLAPVANAFYLKPGQLTAGLKFCIGTVHGCYTRPGHPVHTTTVATKEDYELSLRAWWYDGAILRHDGAAPKADHYTPGGCTELRTPQVEQASADTLTAAWPGLVRRNTRRASRYTEILLAPKKRHAGHPPTTPVPGALRRKGA